LSTAEICTNTFFPFFFFLLEKRKIGWTKRRKRMKKNMAILTFYLQLKNEWTKWQNMIQFKGMLTPYLPSKGRSQCCWDILQDSLSNRTPAVASCPLWNCSILEGSGHLALEVGEFSRYLVPLKKRPTQLQTWSTDLNYIISRRETQSSSAPLVAEERTFRPLVHRFASNFTPSYWYLHIAYGEEELIYWLLIWNQRDEISDTLLCSRSITLK
jgi:hypothetical protein